MDRAARLTTAIFQILRAHLLRWLCYEPFDLTALRAEVEAAVRTEIVSAEHEAASQTRLTD